MCHFITTTLPAAANTAAVRHTAGQFGMRWQPLTNPHVLAQLGAGMLYFSTTRGQCHCGTVIGSASRAGSSTSDTRESAQETSRKRVDAGKDGLVARRTPQK